MKEVTNIIETTADDLYDRIVARAKEICRLPDGSPCLGPDIDCHPSDCRAMAQADQECRKL